MAATFESIIRDLKNKIYHPVYFLHGEEAYFIDKISKYIEENVLDEGEKEFNYSVLYGRETDVSTLMSVARRFPMMANYHVVIVREAQSLKNLFPRKKEDGGDGDDDNQGPLLTYLDKPQKSTILVFCYKYKKIDGRTKLAKTLDKKAVLFESKKLYDTNVPAWIQTYASENKIRISDKAAYLLTRYHGTDLERLAGEIDKILLNVKPGEEIQLEHIEKFSGFSKDFNVFELQKALGMRDALMAFRIANHMGKNKKDNPMPLVMGNLYSYFSKILLIHSLSDKSAAGIARGIGVPPFFAQEYITAARNYPRSRVVHIISIINRYDLASKGVNAASTDEKELLRELVIRILGDASVAITREIS